ncbi:hypothetical protein [Streptomyces sp. BK022]|uniref:MmyB family transcriptional regulator n=1 Tax=Streptomyces sp. BK022 TaxID=2512123 RepID=UPI001F5FE5E0|nr:hypothetical protein [Streptomyces sp. BK022]
MLPGAGVPSGVNRSGLRAHPTAGPLDLTFETLTLPSPAGQRVITYTAEPGSASERALRLLVRTGPGAHPLTPWSAQR